MTNYKSKKISFYNIIKYLIFFILLCLTKKASINSIFFPFCVGMFIALVWCNQNILILSPMYVISNYIIDNTLIGLYSSVAVVIVMLICYGIHLKFKKPIKPTLLLVYALISQAVMVYLKIDAGELYYIVLAELIMSMLFMFACMKIFETTIIRGINGKLTASEIICGATVVIAIISSLFDIAIYEFEVLKFVSLFLILFCNICFDMKTTMLMGFIIALGTIIPSNNPVYVAPILIWTTCTICYSGKSKYIMCATVLISEILCGYYFEFYYGYNIMSFIPCLVSCVFLLLIPQKYVSLSHSYYSSTFGKLTMQNLIMQNRNNIQKRLSKLSQVFFEMDKVFRSMIKGKMAKEELKTLLNVEVKSKTCENCPDKNRCYRTYFEETNSILDILTETTFEKGKITLIDIPSVLTSRCHRINQMVFHFNNLMEQYKSYASLVGSIDASRMLIAEQLYGVARIMSDLSTELSKNISFDKSKEKRIIDELTYNNIICSDVLIYHEEDNVYLVSLAVRKEDSLKSKIPQIVSSVCKTKMTVMEEESSEKAGWQILNMRVAPKFNVSFGTASQTKTTSCQSGDCYSIIRIAGDKILMALCDGMGSGEKAERASSTAISLVENFYKAGFDNQIILSSVNKFLSLGTDDVFSCLDMCILDLKNGRGDFIKLGAVNGYIKHNDTTEMIKSGTLPLGIISSAEPSIRKKSLIGGDMVILCTDGVSDSFSDDETLQDYINNIRSLNPQVVADTLLQTAIANNKGISPDDMTIIVAKIFESA